MKIRSIAVRSLVVGLASTSMVVHAQGQRLGGAVTMSWIGNTCPIRMSMNLNLEPSASASVVCGDSNPVFLSFANALFNPREYTIGRTATVTTNDPAGRSTSAMTISPPESFRALLAGATSLVGSGGSGRRTVSGNNGQPSVMDQIVANELVPFFASDDSVMLRLPPAVEGGAVDPVGHIVCVVKTKTKSNQTNDRIVGDGGQPGQGPYVDEIGAQNVRILLAGVDGKDEQVLTPISMGAFKLTKADAGRALDATVAKEMKIQSWVKDCFDKRMTAYDPSLTNVLQFDLSSVEAERLRVRFQPGQSLRVKVKFPWLCDAECTMTEPIGKSWIENISATRYRVSIITKEKVCRVIPTVNK